MGGDTYDPDDVTNPDYDDDQNLGLSQQGEFVQQGDQPIGEAASMEGENVGDPSWGGADAAEGDY